MSYLAEHSGESLRLLTELALAAVPAVQRLRRHLDDALQQHLAARRRANQIDGGLDGGRNCVRKGLAFLGEVIELSPSTRLLANLAWY